MRPVHPGEILREDFLKPINMSGIALARHLGIPASRINHILLEQRSITADIALRLSRYFGGDARSWLNLQTAFDLRTAELNPELQATLDELRPLRPRSA